MVHIGNIWDKYSMHNHYTILLSYKSYKHIQLINYGKYISRRMMSIGKKHLDHGCLLKIRIIPQLLFNNTERLSRCAHVSHPTNTKTTHRGSEPCKHQFTKNTYWITKINPPTSISPFGIQLRSHQQFPFFFASDFTINQKL